MHFVTDINAVAVWVYPFPKLGIETITTEPDPYNTVTLAMAAKLCKEYKINIAVHNHPKKSNNDTYQFWDPNFALGVVKPYFPQIGMCTDVGHWFRSGLVSLDCLIKWMGILMQFTSKT